MMERTKATIGLDSLKSYKIVRTSSNSGRIGINPHQAKKHPSNPLYKYHFQDLEERCREAYEIWKIKKECKSAGYNVFIAMENLCFASLQVSKPLHHVNKAEIATQTAIHLYKRLLAGEFIPEGFHENKIFPWNKYIKRTLLGYIPYPGKNTGGVADFLTVDWGAFSEIDDNDTTPSCPDTSSELIITKKYLRKKIVEGLLLFYKETDLKQYYYSFLSLSKLMDKYPCRNPEIPEYFRKLSVTLLAVAMIVAEDTNIRPVHPPPPKLLSKAIQSAIGSAMFLAAISEENSPVRRELIMALDLSSLSRLSNMIGGQYVYVPTPEELNSVVIVSSTIGEMAATGYDREETEVYNRKKGDLRGSAKVSVNPYITKVIQHHSIFGHVKTESSQAMHDILVQSIRGIENLVDRMTTMEIKSSQVIYAQSELMYTLTNILRMMGKYGVKDGDKINRTAELPGSRSDQN